MTEESKILRTQTFIGSSSEGLIVANAIGANLGAFTECQIWTEGVFLPGRTFIETLEKMLDQMDYAVLVATPDDMLIQRDIESFSMRDNVLLELGLFMAKLGRTRTYLVSPRDKPIRIPSDLLGVTTVNYETAPTPEQANAALAEPCERIKQAMREAEKELSSAMKRIIAKRLLTLTNRVQGLLVNLQSESVRALTDRAAFEKVRTDSADRIAALVKEYQEDAERMGVQGEAEQVTGCVLDAIRSIPYPEEAVVTEGDVVGGVLSHLAGRRSVEGQIRDRFAGLTTRYKDWWDYHGPLILGALNQFQASLISSM
jgi:hypothetical protein